MANGQVCITGAVPPQFPKSTCPSGYFYSQYNGWEPRFGLTYRATITPWFTLQSPSSTITTTR